MKDEVTRVEREETKICTIEFSDEGSKMDMERKNIQGACVVR